MESAPATQDFQPVHPDDTLQGIAGTAAQTERGQQASSPDPASGLGRKVLQNATLCLCFML